MMFVLLVVVLLFSSSAGLTITKHPMNVTECLNDGTQFLVVQMPCGFTGAPAKTTLPNWRIISRAEDGSVISDVTRNATDINNNSGDKLLWVADETNADNNSANSFLLIGPLDKSYNQSSYQCSFQLDTTESKVGTITLFDAFNLPTILMTDANPSTITVSLSSLPLSCGSSRYTATISPSHGTIRMINKIFITFTGLTSNTSYSITVRVVSPAGNGRPTTMTVMAKDMEESAPVMPTRAILTASSTMVTSTRAIVMSSSTTGMSTSILRTTLMVTQTTGSSGNNDTDSSSSDSGNGGIIGAVIGILVALVVTGVIIIIIIIIVYWFCYHKKKDTVDYKKTTFQSISEGNTAEGTTTTKKNYDLQSEPLVNEQYADVQKLHNKTATVLHQAAPSGEEYALSTKTTNDDAVKQPKPTPSPMEYAVVDLQKKTTESPPQQLVAEYDVIKDPIVDLQNKTTESPPQQLVAEYDVIKDDDVDDTKPANQGLNYAVLEDIPTTENTFRLEKDLSSTYAQIA